MPSSVPAEAALPSFAEAVDDWLLADDVLLSVADVLLSADDVLLSVTAALPDVEAEPLFAVVELSVLP